MLARLQVLGGGLLVVLGVAGCPVTDDYYIDAGPATSGGTGAQNTGETSAGAYSGLTAGAAAGGSAHGGSGGSVDMLLGGFSGGQATEGGALGMPSGPCVPTTERCNGHDDDCDEFIDELACNTNTNGTTGCAGFTVASEPNHGYMLCTGTAKDFMHAKETCAGQEMRLAWLESATENTEVAAAVKKLTSLTDILFGATDQMREGDWVWDGVGGFQFWKGTSTGAPVAGKFNSWLQGTPNNDNNNEDCIVLNPATAYWGDRTCSGNYAFLCEDLKP
jgi:hypothetical protein